MRNCIDSVNFLVISYRIKHHFNYSFFKIIKTNLKTFLNVIIFMKYKIIEDLTSDVMFEAYGKDKKELFENAAEALFSVICDIKKVRPLEKITVEISAENFEELLIEWLQHLIALVDIEEMFFSRFEIRQISNTKLKAVCYGSIA